MAIVVVQGNVGEGATRAEQDQWGRGDEIFATAVMFLSLISPFFSV